MKYSSLVRSPGSLVPKSAQKSLMKNPGTEINYDYAEACLLRETTMVKDLLAYFLRSPSLDKSQEYWTYFQTQWKLNIVNYVKNTNGALSVSDYEVDHYKNHYKYRTAIRLVEEYVTRVAELDRLKNKFPNMRSNRLLFGVQKTLNDIHARLMPYHKRLNDSSIGLEAIVKR